MPDELWTEVRDIVQETGIKTIPMEKKCKKAKWLSGEALQIAVKRREVKSKGEKERYKHLNAEFQRIARRDKKAFLSDQRFTYYNGTISAKFDKSTGNMVYAHYDYPVIIELTAHLLGSNTRVKVGMTTINDFTIKY